MRIRRIILLCVLCLTVYSAIPIVQGVNDIPDLQDGDLIFQTSWTNQSIAVGLATGSLYLHTGIIKLTDKAPVVVHAGAHVEETPLRQWINGGILQRFAIYRYKNLTPQQGKDILVHARHYYGKAYDIYFLFDNDKLYCSELPYLAYKESGITVGKVEKVGYLAINNYFSRKIIEQRWRTHPKCQAQDMTFDQCYRTIMEQSLVSPASLASDSQLERIFTNYPAL